MEVLLKNKEMIMQTSTQLPTDDKPPQKLHAYALINFIVEKLSNEKDHTQILFYLSQLQQIILFPDAIKDQVIYQQFSVSDRKVMPTPQKVINKLLECLTDVVAADHSTASAYLKCLSAIISNNEFIDKIKRYQDNKKRDIVKIILRNFHYLDNLDTMELIIKNWMLINHNINAIDDDFFQLNSYVLSYSIKLYEKIYGNRSSNEKLFRMYPLEKKLHAFINDTGNLTQKDINECVEAIDTFGVNDVILFQFCKLILKFGMKLENNIVDCIMQLFADCRGKHILYHFTDDTPQKQITYQNTKNFVSICYDYFSADLQHNFVKNLSTSQLSAINRVNTLNEIDTGDMREITAIIANNGIPIDYGELYLLHLLFSKCKNKSRSEMFLTVNAITSAVILGDDGYGVLRNIIKLFLLSLKCGAIHYTDKMDIINEYKKNILLPKSLQINLSKFEYDKAVSSIQLMFDKINSLSISSFNDLTVPGNIQLHDKKEQLVQSILPVQELIAARVRKANHQRFYPLATYQDSCYQPKYLDDCTYARVMKQCDHLDFVPTLIHMTNVTYLHQLLDSAILSRKCLERNNISFFKAALKQSLEPADHDVVCFGISDVDCLALQNGSKEHPPARITFDFKKILQQKQSTLGHIFVKEHDLLWSSKPDSQQERKNHGMRKKTIEFATLDIPSEFAMMIPLGALHIQLYRNACGVKFIINGKKYILHYAYRNGYVSDGIQLQDPHSKANYHIEDEVIETDFGETLYYGPAENIEKFFVMQFFRHIEKLPTLHNIVYQELCKLSDDEMLNFLNKIGKQLTIGSEFNFQRGFYIPINCIKEIEILSQYSPLTDKSQPFSSYYGCNQFFSDVQLSTVQINVTELITHLRDDDAAFVEKIKITCPQLFLSKRFVRHLLDNALPKTKCYELLLAVFNSLCEEKQKPKALTID